MVMKAEPNKTTSRKKPTKVENNPSSLSQGLTQQETMWRKQQVLRFGLDLAGLVLLVLGMLSLLGVLGITRGLTIDRWILNISRWFGIGRFAIPVILIGFGWRVLLWSKNPSSSIGSSRIIPVELSIFTIIAAASAFYGDTVLMVENGTSAGGMVGWGLSHPLIGLVGWFPTGLLYTILTIVLLLFGLNLLRGIENWARSKLGDEVVKFSPALSETSTPTTSPELTTALESKPQTGVLKKASPQPELPLQYAKRSKPNLAESSKPSIQIKRSEDMPPLTLLNQEKAVVSNQATINMNAGLIEKTLSEFGIPAKVVGFRVGPTVTQYAVEPGYIEKGNNEEHQKIRISQISALNRDLALALKAERLRIEAPVPGKSYVGIEVPNSEHTIVKLRPILESEAFQRVNSPLAISLGRDVSGAPVVSDLTTMPHLLIAGTTNSGKSICIAAITTCLAMNNRPQDLRLVMIDPKMVELNRFVGLPHILGQVETNVERIMAVLRWATTEMDNRYKLLEKAHARNLDSYNARVEHAGQSRLPKIVILIDELADLMMSAPEQTETSLVRLAQKARAVGMHLVVATQRPSTDVVTGVIKANFPTRIAFTVASSVDSRVILDTNGAETLLGRGDMLFLHPEVGVPVRSQGVMVSDQEVRRVIQWWQEHTEVDKQSVPSETIKEEPVKSEEEQEETAPWEETVQESLENNSDEHLIKQAVELLRKDKRASASYLQRQLRIGYPKAAWLIDQLEGRGILGPAQSGGKDREILLTDDQNQSPD